MNQRVKKKMIFLSQCKTLIGEDINYGNTCIDDGEKVNSRWRGN